MQNTTFVRNTAGTRGTGIGAWGASTLVAENSTFDSNSAQNGGGLALAESSNTTCTALSVFSNSAEEGGAGLIAGGSAQVRVQSGSNSARCSIGNLTAPGDGTEVDVAG